jgi:hypothetical protein
MGPKSSSEHVGRLATATRCATSKHNDPLTASQYDSRCLGRTLTCSEEAQVSVISPCLKYDNKVSLQYCQLPSRNPIAIMPSSPPIPLVLANILIPIAILTFASGFFPYKPFLPGLANYDESPDLGDPPEPLFDKVVFMVVDALRRCGLNLIRMERRN